MVSQYFSPKEVARALGVSESSLKRWVDKGLIRASKTVGGHRRLELDAVLEYLRQTGRGLQHPQSVDLPAGCGVATPLSIDEAHEPFTKALVEGDEEGARRVVIDLFVSGNSVSSICDNVIAPTFHSVGDLWQCGKIEIYSERRACEICQRVVHELRRAVGAGPEDVPLAMGGTLDGDPYTLATSLAEIVLCSNGWKAMSLGNMLPFETVRAAIVDKRPRLFWVSVTTIRDIDRFAADFNLLFDVAQSTDTALVAGGQALTADVRQKIRYSHFSDNMAHMESFAATIKPRSVASPSYPDQN